MSSASMLLNSNICRTLRGLSLVTRPSAGPGVWLPLLLPSAIILSDLKTAGSSDQYHLSALLCGTLLSSVVMFLLLHMYTSAYISLASVKSSTFVLAAFTSLRLYLFNKRGLIFSILSSCVASFGLGYGTVALLKACPQCFTFGEACLVTQALILFLFSSVNNVYSSWSHTPSTDLDIATIILQVGLLGIAIICTVTYFIPAARSVVPFYSVVTAVLVIGVIPVLHVLLKASPVLWILQLLISTLETVCVIVYWVACCVMAVLAIAHQINAEKKASTVVRKYFHILAVAVYIPGLIYTCCLLYLASGIILAAFIMLELLRILNIPPLAPVLQDGFAVYADEKDAGNLALTPIYLLAGCSMPIWLHPLGCLSIDFLLPLLSGVLSIGVGDTMASTAGTYMGYHKWPGSRKSVEGTFACMAGQMVTWIAARMILQRCLVL
ncbi:dolichol kinase isoform X2 [Anabrus simplex]|uniref:dolichol kinase isoform X2 n=1 Tax=Anabrus simplex TaxID=316456 RepID=UPI0035A37A79